MSNPFIDMLIRRERYEAAAYRYVRAAQLVWEQRVRNALSLLRGVRARKRLRLKEWEAILYEQPWYIKILYTRHRRLATLLIILNELVKRMTVRRRYSKLFMRLLEWAVLKYRLWRWGEAQWKAYRIELMRFYAELYNRIVDRILREAEAVLPLFRVYFSPTWTYYEHEWLSRELARLHPGMQAELLRGLRVFLKKSLPLEQLHRMYPNTYWILMALAYKELGLSLAKRWEVEVIPKFFEGAFGELGVIFYAVFIPRELAEPDPYIGATEPPPVQHWDYAWKFEDEYVPVKSPYNKYPFWAGLFNELGDVFYTDDWRTRLVSTPFEEALILGSHGLWERVGFSILRGFFGTVHGTFGSFMDRRRGAYYLVRTVLHHLGLR